MSTSEKTTYTDLTQDNSTAVNALLGTLTPPRLGEYWLGQGGIYVGSMLDSETQIHVIMATQAFHGKWGTYGETIPGEFSRSNGQHNTALILAAEPDNKLLQAITAYTADGHTDFALPSQFENNLICINARAHIEKCWHWSSTQYSARSAWIQDFEDGYQTIYGKYDSLAARAVRRLIIQ